MSRKETQDKIVINKLHKLNYDRHWYNPKELRTLLGLDALIGGKRRYAQLPIGFMASLGLQLTGKEIKLFTLILEETYSAGYLEWHYSQGMIVRFAQKYKLRGLTEPREIRAAFNSMHDAGLIVNEVKKGSQYSIVKICRGTFLIENFEKVELYRTDRKLYTNTWRNLNPKRGLIFNTKEALIDLGCNNYANSAGLFDLSLLHPDDGGYNPSIKPLYNDRNLEELDTLVSDAELGESGYQPKTELGESGYQPKTELVASLPQVNPATPDAHVPSESLKSSFKSVIKSTDVDAETSSPLNRNAWEEYEAHRIDIKKRLTQSGATKAIKELSAYDYDTQQQMVDKTIMNGWVGLFPIADGTSHKQQSGGNDLTDLYG